VLLALTAIHRSGMQKGWYYWRAHRRVKIYWGLWGETSLLCWIKITKWQKYSQNTTIFISSCKLLCDPPTHS